MKKVIYTTESGALVVISAAGDAHIGMVDNDSAINPRIIEEEELPTDRTFRDAWEDVGLVQVNMDKARDIHKDTLRKLREPIMRRLDIAFMRAYRDMAMKDQIDAKKQILRDVTNHPSIAAARSPDDLKLAGLDVLYSVAAAV